MRIPKVAFAAGLLIAMFATATAAAQERVCTVKPGQTLSAIAKERLGDASRWREIAKANNLASPYKVVAGQTLALPVQPLAPADTSTPLAMQAPAAHLSSPADAATTASPAVADVAPNDRARHSASVTAGLAAAPWGTSATSKVVHIGGIRGFDSGLRHAGGGLHLVHGRRVRPGILVGYRHAADPTGVGGLPCEVLGQGPQQFHHRMRRRRAAGDWRFRRGHGGRVRLVLQFPSASAS